jgi:hypothetical protein
MCQLSCVSCHPSPQHSAVILHLNTPVYTLCAAPESKEQRMACTPVRWHV